jgi:hypothetical protein
VSSPIEISKKAYIPAHFMAHASCKVQAMSKKHLGLTLDDLLKEEGILEEAQAEAVKEVVAWQLAQAMRKNIQGS